MSKGLPIRTVTMEVANTMTGDTSPHHHVATAMFQLLCVSGIVSLPCVMTTHNYDPDANFLSSPLPRNRPLLHLYTDYPLPLYSYPALKAMS
jgi:hypothetical protein